MWCCGLKLHRPLKHNLPPPFINRSVESNCDRIMRHCAESPQEGSARLSHLSTCDEGRWFIGFRAFIIVISAPRASNASRPKRRNDDRLHRAGDTSINSRTIMTKCYNKPGFILTAWLPERALVATRNPKTHCIGLKPPPKKHGD